MKNRNKEGISDNYNLEELGFNNKVISQSSESQNRSKDNITTKQIKEYSCNKSKEENNNNDNSFVIHIDKERKNICCNELNNKCSIF